MGKGVIIVVYGEEICIIYGYEIPPAFRGKFFEMAENGDPEW